LKHTVVILILLSLGYTNIILCQDREQIRMYSDSFRLAKDDTSRINALRRTGTFYRMIEPDSAIYFTKLALALSEKIKWTKGIAQSCLNLGADYIDVSKYDSAIFFETKALQAANIVGDKNRISLIYINRGAAYTETQQFEKALPDLTAAMRLAEEMNNKDRESRAAQGICELYLYQHNNDAALPWGKKALQLANELGDEQMQGTAETSLSGIYVESKDYKKAEQLLLDAIPKLKAAHKTDVVMSAAITLGEIYNATFQYQKALAVLQEALHEGMYTNEADQMAALYNTIGDTYFNIEQYNEAISAYKKGFEMVKGKDEFQQRQYGNLEGLSKVYAKLGDFKNAFTTAQSASILKDSETEKTQNETILKLQTQFETETKEKEIDLLKKDKELNQASLQKQKIFQYAAYIIFFLLVMIAFLIINRYRIKQRAKRFEEIEKMRNNIARNLHDDIGSTLTSINILSKVALQTELNDASKTNIQKIKERSAEIMESMNDIVWAINPANDSLDKIILRMKEFGAEITEQAGVDFIFTEDDDLNEIKLLPAKRNNLYLVYKEALNNAVKYSKAKKVNVFLKKDDSHLILKIEDDGKGFDVQQNRSGNGLKNMRSRTAEIKASLQLQSEKNKGTLIELIISIP
jgi:signal transduction histidine kinase